MERSTRKLSRTRRALVILAAALAAVVMVPSPAHAAGSWTGFTTGPTIFQTNWYYDSSDAVPPGGTTGTITNVSWSVNLSSYPSGLDMWLCHDPAGCLNLPFATGSSLAFNGLTANAHFYFLIGVLDSTTHTIVPQITSGQHRVSVFHT